ncbi:hypothetical protein MTO96_033093 [Rhipicephalus appendiculatus]
MVPHSELRFIVVVWICTLKPGVSSSDNRTLSTAKPEFGGLMGVASAAKETVWFSLLHCVIRPGCGLLEKLPALLLCSYCINAVADWSIFYLLYVACRHLSRQCRILCILQRERGPC